MSIGKFSSEETLGGKEGPSEMSDDSIPMWKSYLMKKSWVMCPTPPMDRLTPLPFNSGTDEYLRLLRDAQRDSTHSSARHSRASSRRDTPRGSPKSPPNSPNTELSNNEDELKGIYINHTCYKDDQEKGMDLMYEWNSRHDPTIKPKDWKLQQLGMARRKTYSIRTAKVGKNGLFSKEVLYTLFLTNILSVIIGSGIGIWLTRRGLMVSRVTME